MGTAGFNGLMFPTLGLNPRVMEGRTTRNSRGGEDGREVLGEVWEREGRNVGEKEERGLEGWEWEWEGWRGGGR